MQLASENMDFEEAIRYRDLMESIKKVSQTQKMSDNVGRTRILLHWQSTATRQSYRYFSCETASLSAGSIFT